ncbi:MAG: WD40/YVTN/BNR-like repeat-containing protein [Longimicrobiales bacterium]
MIPRRSALVAALAVTALPLPAAAQPAMHLDSTWLAGLGWRPIGPANMMGRVTDVEGIPSPSKTFYFAAATGGIWKSTNNGTTFRAVFDDQRVTSMGDLAIAPSDTLQIWAGTGEEDSRNSISPGGGIFKSTDGGMTWSPMGLEATETIGRIVVHPTNPEIVWVAALGAIWRSNPERGLYKTTDGGRNWRAVKQISDKAGFVDVAIDPANPDHLIAASWERVRGPYFLKSGGPGSGLWNSTDGGETWTQVTGGGLPETELGRMGIAFANSNPRIIYLMVEASPQNDSTRSGLYRSNDGGQSWTQMNTTNSRPFYYSQVRVDPKDPERVYFSSFNFSEDGGKTVRGAAEGVHVDHHAQWIDPNDPDRFITGNDGGIAITFDRGGNYIFPNSVPLGQFYNISYDMGVPYRVCGGLQDNYSWCGPSRKADDDITNHDWFSVSGGDGFVTQQDPRDPNIIYSESQGGNMGRLNYATGERISLQKPNWRDKVREWQDSIATIWPDTTRRPSGDVRRRVDEFRRRASADSAVYDLRYNWNTPFLLSPHDPDVFYAGANRVLRSTNRGEGLTIISPDLSKQDMAKVRVSTQTTGGITRDATGAETYGTIVSLAESPRRRGLLFAGTDDGNVWSSPDDGGSWNNITDRFHGMVPDTTYVSRIEPSHHDTDRIYITFDNHRRGDFTSYVLMSDDGGDSFRSIASNLPTGSPDFAHVIREDPTNPDLLFVGTDVGAYVSLDRGTTWQKFMFGMPTVPVHDLKIHPRDRELIAGTHGRSIYIADIAPLQVLNPTILASNAHLFPPRPAFHYGGPPTGGEFTAHLYFLAGSPDYGAQITYWLGQEQDDEVRIAIVDARGDTISTVSGPGERGLHTVDWNLRGPEPDPIPLSPSERRDSIATESRLVAVADSFVRAGRTQQAVDSAVTSLRAGGQGGGRGGRGGGGGDDGEPPRVGQPWADRPGEGEARGGGGGRGRGGAGGGGGGGGNLGQEILQAVRGQTGGGGRGGRGGGGALFTRRSAGPTPLAADGSYTVSITISGRTLTQPLRVERAPTAPTR